MKAFKDDNDGYYEFSDDAPEHMYSHLTSTALRVPTPQTEEEIEAEKDALVTNLIQQNRSIIKAVILAYNKGTLVPGTNATPSHIKNAIRDEL